MVILEKLRRVSGFLTTVIAANTKDIHPAPRHYLIRLFRRRVDTETETKVAVLKETLGWSQEEVNLAVCKAPWILVASEERLRRNAEFLIKEVGLQLQYITRHPVLLMYSLERRLVPRHLVVKVLKERGLIEEDRCFFNVVAPTEEKFLEKFVAPYEKCIPWLADAYEVACAGKVPVEVEL